MSEAIATGNVQAINYFVAQKYIDALGKLASANNSKVILMPLEASQVIGAVGGIGEIVKADFRQQEKAEAIAMWDFLQHLSFWIGWRWGRCC